MLLRAALVASMLAMPANPGLHAQADAAPASLAIAAAGDASDLIDRLRRAITSDQPGIRLVAARIASNRSLMPLVPDLVRALDQETDFRTAAVILKALLDLGGAQATDAVVAYSGRAPAEAL